MKRTISAFWHFSNIAICLARSIKISLKVRLSISINRLIFRLSIICVSAWICTMTDFSWSIAKKLNKKIAILIDSFAFFIFYMRIDEMFLMIILEFKMKKNSLLTSDIVHFIFIQTEDLISDWSMKATAVTYFHCWNE